MFKIGSIHRFNTFKTALILIICGFLVYLTLYNFGSTTVRKQFPNITKISLNGVLSVNSTSRDDTHKKSKTVDVVVLFTKTSTNQVIQTKFSNFVHSLLKHASANIVLHIVGDAASQKIATKIFSTRVKHLETTSNYKIRHHDLEEITKHIITIVKSMQEHFSYKPGSYYSDALFFISLALHRIFYLNRVVMVDVDVNFVDDVWKLYKHFDNFHQDAVIGIAYEQQPVYRHVFQLYRTSHVNTTVGDPPPKGNPGFNSGVLLLNLDKMRKSNVYNNFLEASVVDDLARKYQFKGHLGDQDFFSLISLERKELFYILPCGWNRQLCQWWRDHGYSVVFDAYHRCDRQIYLYHGNCNSKIP